jgi:hypothetical protein
VRQFVAERAEWPFDDHAPGNHRSDADTDTARHHAPGRHRVQDVRRP